MDTKRGSDVSERCEISGEYLSLREALEAKGKKNARMGMMLARFYSSNSIVLVKREAL